MNASIEFIKKRIAEGECADWIPKDGWDGANVLHPIKFLKSQWETDFLSDDMKTTLTSGCYECDVHIIYKPDCDFDYVSFEHCYHDGTAYFLMDTVYKTAVKPFGVQTYNKIIAPNNYNPESLESVYGYNYEYFIGDCVVLNKYGESPDKNKPWLHEHTIVGMPIKMRFIDKEGESVCL